MNWLIGGEIFKLGIVHGCIMFHPVLQEIGEFRSFPYFVYFLGWLDPLRDPDSLVPDTWRYIVFRTSLSDSECSMSHAESVKAQKVLMIE